MNVDSSLPDPRAFHRFKPQSSSTSIASLRSSRQQRAELEVVTAEGDRISLTAMYRDDRSLDRYESQLRGAGRAIGQRIERLSVERSASVAFEVDGDLNEQERADLRRLVEDIEAMGASLLSGTLEPGLQLGSTLASASGRLSLSESFEARVEQTKAVLSPGRAQRKAADRVSRFLERRPERAAALAEALPEVADKIFDRLGDRFGQERADAARSAFQRLLANVLSTNEPETVPPEAASRGGDDVEEANGGGEAEADPAFRSAPATAEPAEAGGRDLEEATPRFRAAPYRTTGPVTA